MLPLVLAVGLACTDVGRIGCAVDTDCCDGVCVRNRCLAGVPTTTDTTVPPTSTTSTTVPPALARMVTGRDVTIRYSRQDECRWWNGQTATQDRRLAEYLACEARFLPEGLLYAANTLGCRGVAHGQSASDLETEDTRLRVFYTDPNRDGEWSILSGGCPDYDHCKALGRRLQACSTANDAVAARCAASPFMTPDLLDWTDMAIVDGACVPGAAFDVVIPDAEDFDVRARGTIRFDRPLTPLTDAQRALLADLLVTHHRQDQFLCGLADPPDHSVKAAAVAFLASAADDDQRTWFTLEFTGAIDPAYDAQTVCDLSMLAGYAMDAWGACFDLGPLDVTTCLVRTRASHETVHRMRALHNDGLLRIGDHDDHQLTSTVARSIDDWLACVRDPTLGCRPAWLPADWRVIMPVATP